MCYQSYNVSYLFIDLFWEFGYIRAIKLWYAQPWLSNRKLDWAARVSEKHFGINKNNSN